MIAMKTRMLVTLMICLLAAPATSMAQRRRKSTPKTSSSAATDQAAQVGRRAAAARIATEVKTLTHFMYLLGGVVKSVEAVDRAASESGVAEAAQRADQNKASIKQSIQNVQVGLNQLENDFSANASLRPYYHLILGVSDAAGQASRLAEQNQFDQAGRSLLVVLDKLTDALVALNQAA